MPKLSATQHQNFTFWGMAFIALGLPLSVFLVSVGIILLASNWFLEGNHVRRIKQFFTDPISIFIISIFAIYLLGMIHTENIAHGIKDLRIKLPILVLPFLLFTSKMPNQKRQQDILMLFVLGCVVGSVLGVMHFMGLTGNDVLDKRNLSAVISHIRFGLMLTMAIFILLYYLSVKWKIWSVTEKLVCLTIVLWLFYFMVLMEAATGYLAFAVLLSLSLLRLLVKSGSYRLKLLVAMTIIVGALASTTYVHSIYANHVREIPINQLTLTVKTTNGNYYAHQKDVPYRENGHRVWNFVCYQELEKEWPRHSEFEFESTDLRGQPLKFTIIRYLSSLGLRKDSVGLSKLSANDLSNIERGFTNYKYTSKWGVSRRIAQLFWEMEEYAYNGNANHSSLLQRWVYFKVGISIIQKNPVSGVGTGDIIDSYKEAYRSNDHGLLTSLQGISHNQFLSVAIVLGSVGLIWFIIAFFYPLQFYYKDYLYVMFLALILSSFMTDNTLDSQSGVTLFAFFNAFLIIRKEFTPDQ